MNSPVVIGNATLYLADCRELFDAFPADASLIMDPPYGIGYAHKGFHDGSIGRTGAANKRGAPPVIGDDAPFDPSPWLRFKNALMWGANHYHARLPDSGRWLAWNKLGDMEPWDSFSDVEADVRVKGFKYINPFTNGWFASGRVCETGRPLPRIRMRRASDAHRLEVVNDRPAVTARQPAP
jgi:hypothetical protein